MTSEVSSMLSEGTIDLGLGNKGFFTYHFLIPMKNGESCFIINLKPLHQIITYTKFMMTTLERLMEVICLRQWAVSLNIKSAYCHIPIVKRHHCFFHFRWKDKVYQFKTLSFGLFKAPRTFMRVMKANLLLWWRMAITLFLYLDNVLVLANSYTQAKEDGQRVVQLLQRLGFVLRWEKCQLEPTQEFTHLGFMFNTQNMSLLLPQDKVLMMKAQAVKVATSPTCRGVMRLLGLMNFASMALLLARLHSTLFPYSTGSRRITRLHPICWKGWS